jgi:ornithine carbamoyltransferase
MKDLISMSDLKGRWASLIELADDMKENPYSYSKSLEGATLALLFEKPSTRTRASFECGMHQLGGNSIFLSSQETQLGRGEPIKDTARVLSRYADGISYRGHEHWKTLELAEYSEVPVINALDELEHPCQALSDLFTIWEFMGSFDLKLCYLGDGNNVCNSLAIASALAGIEMVCACPEGHDPKTLEIAKGLGGRVKVERDPEEAAQDADVLYTDVWISMGEEGEEKRIEPFKPFQLNSEILELAKSDCLVMHCLPAHRGLEITDDVLESENSVVFEQAENRLHAQKALLLHLILITPDLD